MPGRDYYFLRDAVAATPQETQGDPNNARAPTYVRVPGAEGIGDRQVHRKRTMKRESERVSE